MAEVKVTVMAHSISLSIKRRNIKAIVFFHITNTPNKQIGIGELRMKVRWWNGSHIEQPSSEQEFIAVKVSSWCKYII